ncbi:unnamed protein product, partial [Heterosigma akashiwo]
QFLALDLDYLFSFNSCPQNSFVNVPERVMPLFNIAFNATSNCRSRMTDEDEWKLRNASSMAAIRKVIEEEQDGLGTRFRQSVQPVIDNLSDRAMKISWKGEPMRKYSNVSEGDLHTLFQYIKDIDPTMEVNFTTAKQWEAHPDWLDWLERHTCSSWYSFQVKKCNQPDCCRPVRMDKEIFQSLDFLPEGELDHTGKHYLPFSKLYRQPQPDPVSLVPSQQKLRKMTVGKGVFAKKNVRGVIWCVDCGFPRSIYFDKKIFDVSNSSQKASLLN